MERPIVHKYIPLENGMIKYIHYKNNNYSINQVNDRRKVIDKQNEKFIITNIYFFLKKKKKKRKKKWGKENIL